MTELALYVDPVPAHCLFEFPKDKDLIAKLSQEEKAHWYQYQFERNPGIYPIELTTKEFMRFWKWHYYVPIRVKRFFYRLKTGQIFKKYEHISAMKERVKKHGI